MKPVEFKVKRHFWMWALGTFFHLFALGAFMQGVSFFAVIAIFIDIFIIFPEIHVRYIFTDREIIVKRLLYPDIHIFFVTVTSVDNATLLTFGGFALHIMENSMGAYKIVYTKGRRHRHSAVIICPKDGARFIRELESHIDKNVIVIGNTESAFKKKKDKL
jgi:hypothetical protein